MPVPERLRKWRAVGGNTASLSISRHGDRLAYTESILDTNIWRMNGPAVKGGDHRPAKLIASTRQERKPSVFTGRQENRFHIWIDQELLRLGM